MSLLTPSLLTDALEREEESWDAPIVMIGGAIKYWWDENWDLPEHWEYVKWRDDLSHACIEAGYLVYRPDMAFKGTWNKKAQKVNDLMIELADLFVVASEWDIPSIGTDKEIAHAEEVGTPWLRLPPKIGLERAVFAIGSYLR